MSKRIRLRKFFTSHSISYVIISYIISIIAFGFLVANIESDIPEGNIRTFQDGIWWAFISVTTIGYGDHFPVSPMGRLLGTILIGIGLIFFSLITAHIASLFVGADKHEEYDGLHEHIQKLENKIDKLSERMQ